MIRLVNKPDIEAPSANYPFGSIQDDSAGIDGTPLNRLVHSDQHQFFEKLIEDGEVTANNLPDNSLNGYQLNEALDNRINKFDFELFHATNQNISTTDVWQVYYLDIKNTSGTTWTWQNGSVTINNKLYFVSSGTVTLSGPEFLVYYYIDNKHIGIRKNTDNGSFYLQAVDLLKYTNLEISGTVGLLNYKLVKRGNVWTFTGHGQLPASSIVLLKNYRGQNYEAGLIVSFPFYIFEAVVTPFIIRGDLSKNINNDLVFSFSNTSQIFTNFSISWIE